MPKIQKMRNTLTVNIPHQVARIKGWSKGTEVFITIDYKTRKILMDKLEEAKWVHNTKLKEYEEVERMDVVYLNRMKGEN